MEQEGVTTSNGKQQEDLTWLAFLHKQVKKELRHIFAQYEPLLQKEESERTLRWAQFLGGLSAPDGQQQPGDSQQ